MNNDKKISVSTRFHSWAENDFSLSLDLNQLLIKNPSATFFIRVKGDSLILSGICSEDILIVDRAVSVTHNKMIVARLHEELIIRRITFQMGKIFLSTDNPSQEPIAITAETDFEVWGVVIYVIHQI